ncbi:hypothetical protein ABZW18_30380 [Streptomyces sp. NPDC004647]|uniref:hypothetical protein n=1 Tax=Streptomyces sp. NPDC004647 TaxID=3154671 RepID=UPI0033B5D63E
MRYAEARLGDGRAGAGAVTAAFRDLCVIWGDVLRSSCPAAVGWRVLGQAVAVGWSSAAGPAGEADALHRVLPDQQADAVLLHYRLGMALEESADLMGMDVAALGVQLRVAERLLPPRLAFILGTVPPGR